MRDAAAILLTAANEPYWRCLYQFLRNIERRRFHRGHRVIAYDLGLEPQTLARLTRLFSWCEFRRFRFEDFPPHLAMAERTQAWKPPIVWEVLKDSQVPVLWCDSATLFRTRDLKPVVAAIRACGVLVSHGQASAMERCDARVLDALSVPLELRLRPEIMSGLVGFDPAWPAVRDIVRQWAEMALVEAFMRPSQPRYKRDQALLTALVLPAAEKGLIRLPGTEIDISSARPIRWASSRNIVPAHVPMLLDPWVRLRYRSYKAGDRVLWRLKQFRDTRLQGALRRLEEHFSVLIRTATGKTWRLIAPRGCHFARPFLARRNGRRALLVERFDYRMGKGELCAIALDDDLAPGSPVPILSRRYHVSHPYVFGHEDALYLVPETRADRTIEIWRCTEFPGRWQLVAMPLRDVDATGTVVFFRDGLWWMFTFLSADGGPPSLAIFFTRDFPAGPWHPHPINDGNSYQGAPFASAGNGGAVFASGDALLRPARNGRRRHGEDLRLMRIEVLTPDEYREHPHDGPHPADELLRAWSPHHLSIDGDVVAFDVRDRARGRAGLWPLPVPPRPSPDADIAVPAAPVTASRP